jgi:uncharacterized protein
MSKKQEIQSAMTAAMKAKDAPRLQAIRGAWNAIRKKEIDTRVDLTDADVEKTLLTLLKQSQESLDQAKAANRPETVAEVEAEMSVWKEFLPKPLSAEELAVVVAKVYEPLQGKLPAGGAGMGMLMKAVMAEVGARASGAEIQAQVKKTLGI